MQPLCRPYADLMQPLCSSYADLMQTLWRPYAALFKNMVFIALRKRVKMFMEIENKKARYTASKSRAGGQGPYFTSLDHLARSSEVQK